MEVKIFYTADKFDSQPFVDSFEEDGVTVDNMIEIGSRIVRRVLGLNISGKVVTEVVLENTRKTVTIKKRLVPFASTETFADAIEFLFK